MATGKRRVIEALRRTGIVLCTLALAGTVAVGVEASRIGPPPLANAQPVSVTILDRDDVLLRAYTTETGRWRLPIDANDVDPTYLKLLFAFEDQRFYKHRGVDPVGVFRVLTEVVRHGRLISGSSTLTMQTARLVEGRHEKTGAGKLRQMIRAVQLEQRLSKHEILNIYLKLAPFGGNIEGVRAASLLYLGKEPRRLSLAEAALLVALPQSPELRRPDRFPEAAKRARNRVLARARDLGVISRDGSRCAEAERDPTPDTRVDPAPGAAPRRCRASRNTRASPAASTHAASAPAGTTRTASERSCEDARRAAFGGDRRARPYQRRRPRLCRLVRISRRRSQRRDRHDARHPLARLDAQAVHLRPRLRRRHRTFRKRWSRIARRASAPMSRATSITTTRAR